MIKFKSPHELAGLSQNEPILLALSGGADSAVLLHLLAKYSEHVGCKLFAAHVDHMIRENEHERDCEFCRALAKKYGIEIFVLKADIPALARESGESEELTARRVRYEFFSDIMKENGIKILATAHNADDNLETVLFNLTRGTGLRGICGIPGVRKLDGGFAVRPILETEKSAIIEYCRENGIDHVEDSTNALDCYSRNRIRLRVIPELKKINPDAANAAARLASVAELELDFIEKSAEALIGSDGSLDVKKLCAAHPAPARHALLIAFDKISGASLESVHVEALLALCQNGKGFSSVSLPRGFSARIESGRLCFIPEKKFESACENYEIRLTSGKNDLGQHIILYEESENAKNIYKSETRITIAFDKIVGDVCARTRRAGDKIIINGMHKDVRKLISEKKIPPELRSSLPVIFDGEEILWVPGVAVADKIKKYRGEGKCITLTLQKA